MKQHILLFALLSSVALIFTACDKNNNINIFSIEDDKQLGLQVSEEIAQSPTEFPILSETEYSEAYQYLNNILDRILASDDIAYKDEFDWKIHIIAQVVLNAFSVPRGYTFFQS